MATPVDRQVKLNRRVDLSQRGSSGLKRWGGIVTEDTLPRVVGRKAIEVYREMAENDPICGTILHAIDKLCRGVKWRVKQASGADQDTQAAEFLETVMHDMELPWVGFVSEMLSMVAYGHSLHEKVYKIRGGDNPDHRYASRYSDGRIGWRGLPMRAQETIHRWLYDDGGTLYAVEQIAPPNYRSVTIPVDKLLLFRTSVEKNSPIGRSIFRAAYKPWYRKRGIEDVEAIGVERDLAGLPVCYVPEEALLPNASEGMRKMADDMFNVVTNIRRDEQEGIVMPSSFDEKGNRLYELQLLTTGGSRSFDTDKIIQRYDHRIAVCALADFLLLGQGQSGSGSWAMHSDKTQLFAKSVNAYLDIACETLNRFAVPELFKLNDFQISDYPKLECSGIESVDLGQLGTYLQALSASGAQIFPNETATKYLLELAGVPSAQDKSLDVAPEVAAQDESTQEITDAAAQGDSENPPAEGL